MLEVKKIWSGFGLVKKMAADHLKTGQIGPVFEWSKTRPFYHELNIFYDSFLL
jgi:hypothetical protein